MATIRVKIDSAAHALLKPLAEKISKKSGDRVTIERLLAHCLNAGIFSLDSNWHNTKIKAE